MKIKKSILVKNIKLLLDGEQIPNVENVGSNRYL